MNDFLSALCLVAVIEGLFLFAAPLAWKRMASQMLGLPSSALRRMGGLVLVIGLGALWWCRH